jgi:hypothetical protein
VRFEEVKRFALSLPETTEEPHFDMSSFRVRGKIFVTVPPEKDRAHIFVDEHETKAAVAGDASVFEELWWGKRLSGIRVNLKAADRETVYELIEEAWRRKAPKKLIAARDAT